MQKILTLALLVFISTSVRAQLDKKTWLLGGAGNFNSNKYKLNGTPYKYSQLDLSINAGYFVREKLATGLLTSLSVSRSNTAGGTDIDTYVNFTPSAFIRYYLLQSDRSWNLFTQGSFGYQTTDASGTEGSSNATIYRISAGPEVFFNSSVGLEFSVGYQYLKNGSKSAAIPGVHSIFTSIGFQFHLEKD